MGLVCSPAETGRGCEDQESGHIQRPARALGFNMGITCGARQCSVGRRDGGRVHRQSVAVGRQACMKLEVLQDPDGPECEEGATEGHAVDEV